MADEVIRKMTNLTQPQADWLAARAKAEGVSEAAILRRLVMHAMMEGK